MTILNIIEAPAPLLKQVSKPVETFDDALKTLVDDMLETMYAADGIGLAAIQVGEPIRLLVIDLQPVDEDAEPEECSGHHGEEGGETHTHQPSKKEPQVFINPEILDPSEDKNSHSEGCLSVPDIYADIERPTTCRLRWQDLDGNAHEEQLSGMMATCMQHEMDHLNGILFIDHLSRLKRNMALKKLDKARKAA